MRSLMKTNHLLRLLELEESVLITQVKNYSYYVFVFFFTLNQQVCIVGKVTKLRKVHDIY